MNAASALVSNRRPNTTCSIESTDVSVRWHVDLSSWSLTLTGSTASPPRQARRRFQASHCQVAAIARTRLGPRLAALLAVRLETNTIDALESAMTFHRERHSVLAGNVANLDTPGYRPLDLVRGSGPGSQPMLATSFDDGGALQGPDGNAVALERELAKIDANRARYTTSTELVSRRIALLRYAAGDGV
jgi:flagellar basal body rod protein FlgB